MCQRWRAGAAGLDQASQWQCGWGGGEAANTTEQFWYLKDHLSFERTPFWCLSPQCYAWHHFFLERTSRPPRIPWQGLFFQVPAWKSDLTIWANPTASFYFSDVDQKKKKSSRLRWMKNIRRLQSKQTGFELQTVDPGLVQEGWWVSFSESRDCK